MRIVSEKYLIISTEGWLFVQRADIKSFCRRLEVANDVIFAVWKVRAPSSIRDPNFMTALLPFWRNASFYGRTDTVLEAIGDDG